MAAIADELNGAWEEPGVIGTRVEISGKKITVLWRNSPVLETTFSKIKKEDVTVLELKDKSLKNGNSEYATVESLVLKDGVLSFTKNFSITGPSTEDLKKTKNGRYGNYETVDGILKELQGSWRSGDGAPELIFKKNKMTLFGTEYKVHVLRPNYESGTVKYVIADEDPSKYEFGGITRPEYCGGVITARLIVCDGPSIELVFRKD
ncbi:MAG: hypothetical protein IJS71_08835 [Clostridia bacterium]|nr:hypothetical protein [Clostridia bacterium]